MPKIIVDTTPTLRTISISNNTKVMIDNLDLCIDNSLIRDNDIFAIIKGQESKLYDIIRLVPIKPYDKSHTVYNIVPGVKLRIKEEQVLFRLAFFNKNKFEQRMSNSVQFILLTDNYELSRQIALAQELGLLFEGYYKSIINLYNDLKKGDTSNDS